MPNLVIIRGLPGSGKSTYAKKEFPSYEHVEADQYFMKNDKYEWNGIQLHNAHSYCFNSTLKLLLNGTDVVVSNTFVTRSDITSYLNIADLVPNLTITIVELHSHYGSIHNIPEDTINKMKAKWQHIPSYWKYQPIMVGK